MNQIANISCLDCPRGICTPPRSSIPWLFPEGRVGLPSSSSDLLKSPILTVPLQEAILYLFQTSCVSQWGLRALSCSLWERWLYVSHWWSQNFSAQAWSVLAWEDWVVSACVPESESLGSDLLSAGPWLHDFEYILNLSVCCSAFGIIEMVMLFTL